jgi:crotonobetainyl-CoA:carnitine CoA-transferase CaiB-like acyl-CoA transferase
VLTGQSPFLGAGNKINGYLSSLGSLSGADGLSPAVWDFYRTADDRWAIPIACYPRTRDGLLTMLGCAHSRSGIQNAIGRWNSAALEEEAARYGIPLAIVRDRDEFLSHPQGQAVLAEPVVSIEKIGDAPPKPLPAGPRPLSGLRCLQFTHILAGTAVGGALAEYGADALHVCEPNDFEHDLVWNESALGVRSTRLDLRSAEAGRLRFDELLRGADVFVQNHRASKIAKLGLTAEECVAASPGLVYCSIQCYGHSGPWRERGGFDQQAQAFVGISRNEGAGPDRPALPPGRMLNDYTAAYLAAAGVIGALIRRAREGGSYVVRVSLAGIANWCWNLGLLDPTTVGRVDGDARLPEPRWQVRPTALGELTYAASPVALTVTPPRWDDPVLVPRGSSPSRWRVTPPVEPTIAGDQRADIGRRAVTSR